MNFLCSSEVHAYSKFSARKTDREMSVELEERQLPLLAKAELEFTLTSTARMKTARRG